MTDIEPLKQVTIPVQYAATYPVRLEKMDSKTAARRLLDAVTNAMAHQIVETWLSDPRSYDIDITLNMKEVK